jgi:thiol-disulfide isomerase/thioredoxin
MQRVKVLLWALGLSLAAVCVPSLAGTPGEVPVGQVLRDATMQGLNSPPRKLSTLRGKPLIINIWASWCGPCRAESASLERLAWGPMGARFNIIGISTDDYADRAKAWLARSNATISHYIDRQLELETMLGARQLPLTILVGADGRVLEKVYGAKEWDGPAARAFIEKTFPGGKVTAAK